jgi:Ca2+-binding EF-hand superfamily protein
MADLRLTDDEIAEIREIFSHYDTNKNGVIERTEFRALLNALQADMSEEEVKAGLRALDDNHNGIIDFDEFVKWWADR